MGGGFVYFLRGRRVSRGGRLQSGTLRLGGAGFKQKAQQTRATPGQKSRHPASPPFADLGPQSAPLLTPGPIAFFSQSDFQPQANHHQPRGVLAVVRREEVGERLKEEGRRKKNFSF